MTSLKNKTVIITGGGRGIGASACKLLADEGANVVITCRTAEEGLSIEKDILSKNGSAKFIPHDVTKEESWQKVIEETLQNFPQIDAVVNNAGSYNYQSILDCSHESFKSLINTSLDGCFLGLKYGTEAIVTYYGAINADQRQENIKKFQDPNSKVRFFIGNPQTGGYGITLTEAKAVIYYSNSYDLEKRLQSEDRAHRIGQKNKVTYIDMMADDTVDEKIVESLRNKVNIATEIMGEDLREWI